MTVFQSTERGYDIQAVSKRTPPGSNAILESLSLPPDAAVRLWVSEIQIGFAMSGSTGQSFRTRSFFPRNFTQPTFTVFCQCPNQKIYGDTLEFIRTTQITFDQSLNFILLNAGSKFNRTIKGSHSGNSAQGYIKSVKRSHERFTYSPDLQFDFVVERFLSPPDWMDKGNQTPSTLKSWSEIIMQHKNLLAKDPDQNSVSPDAIDPVLAPGPAGTTGSRPG